MTAGTSEEPSTDSLGEEPIAVRIGAVALVVMASATTLLRIWGLNPNSIELSPAVLAPTLAASVFGLVWMAVALTRGADWRAAGLSAAAGSFILTSGGSLVEPIGLAGALLPFVIAAIVLALHRRIEHGGLPIRGIFHWAVVAVLLIDISFVVPTFGAHGHEARDDGRVSVSGPSPSTEGAPDVLVMVLDEFASLDVRPLGDAETGALIGLEELGYSVSPTMWSPYTISAASIASTMDASYPIESGQRITQQAALRLGGITRGDNRLVQRLRSQGYRFTMVESGLWMTSCGPMVDRCVEGSWLDESVGTVVERSIFKPWHRRLWGDEFVHSGLHAMSEASRTFRSAVSNGERDLVFVHVPLPHFPFVLDPDCQLDPERVARPHADADVDAYVDQASCVAGWLTETLRDVDAVADTPPAVLITGDHGTGFAKQVLRDPSTWSAAERVERFAVFAAYRLPAMCQGPLDSSPQVVDAILACIDGTQPTLAQRTFVTPLGDDTPVLEVSPDQLHEEARAIQSISVRR